MPNCEQEHVMTATMIARAGRIGTAAGVPTLIGQRGL